MYNLSYNMINPNVFNRYDINKVKEEYENIIKHHYNDTDIDIKFNETYC